MKICVIGAGITGLTAAKLLSEKNEVVVYEKQAYIGGIARTKNVEGIAYHVVGGHCLNSKNKKVMNFIFNKVLPKNDWHHVKRDARIFFHDHFISYPIEFSVKEIAQFDKDLAFNITKDFLSSKENESDNLADWFVEKFGNTLAKEYFIPYNRKIWNQEPSTMSHLWINGKLPLPNKKDFFQALIEKNEDTMPHSNFYYPNSNNQNTFIDALGKGLDIKNNFDVKSIEKSGSKWVVNNKYKYDLVVSTIPLNILPSKIVDVPEEILEEAKKLKYNKVTNVLWETKPVDFTWSYYPSPNTIFHRHIHIGNFFYPRKNYTITESVGEHSYEEMVEHGKKFDYLLEPLGYNVSDHAYVVYDHNYSDTTKKIKKYINDIGLHTVGRFGEWEYYNMDVCMESVMKLVNKIEGQNF